MKKVFWWIRQWQTRSADDKTVWQLASNQTLMHNIDTVQRNIECGLTSSRPRHRYPRNNARIHCII